MRAALWGAAAGAAPDLDILFSITGDSFDQLVFLCVRRLHRTRRIVMP